jgi:predicted metal-dependent peptidase
MTGQVMTRRLTEAEARQLVGARLRAIEYAPYLAHALFAVRPVAAEGLGTFAVDRGWRLYLDPKTLEAWRPATAGAVLVHEVGHLLRAHGKRGDAFGSEYAGDLWNLATDAALNDDLVAEGLPLPVGAVTPGSLGLPDGGIEETYYATLLGRRGPRRSPDPGDESNGPSDGSCGSGVGGPARDYELAADDQQAPAVGVADARLTRRQVAAAMQARAGSGRGTVPGGWQRWAATELAPPTVPWRRVLASAVRRAIAHAAGCADYTYQKPGRRRIPRVVTPALRRPLVTVAVVVDTSGSMSQAQLDAALQEVQGVVRAAGVGPHGTLVLACDAEVGAQTRVRRVAQVQLAGGGGTDLRVGIAAAEESRPHPDVIVVLTDGFTPWPEAPTRGRLVVALIGEAARDDTAPDWAITVRVPA